MEIKAVVLHGVVRAGICISSALLASLASGVASAQSDQFRTGAARGNIVADAKMMWDKRTDTFRQRSQHCLPLLAQAETHRLQAQDFYIDARDPRTPSREASRLQAQGNAQYAQVTRSVSEFNSCAGRAQSDQFQTGGAPQQPGTSPRLPPFQLRTETRVPQEPAARPGDPAPRQVGGISSGGSSGGTSTGGGQPQAWTGSRSIPRLPNGSGGWYGPESVQVTIRDMSAHPGEERYRTGVDLTDAARDTAKQYRYVYGIVDQRARTFRIETVQDRLGQQITLHQAVVVQLR